MKLNGGNGPGGYSRERQINFSAPRNRNRGGRKILRRLPLITGIVFLLALILTTSQHIFSLTRNIVITEKPDLPVESNLANYPGLYEYVDNMDDEREVRVVNIRETALTQEQIPSEYRIK